jgi:hypothetical protein
MSTSSVSSNTVHAIAPEAITAWNDLTVSAADGRVRVVAIEAVSTKTQHNAPAGQPAQPGGSDQVRPMSAATRPQQAQAANDAPAKHAEPSAAADAQAKSQPAADATALLDFALGLCEQSESANSTAPIHSAPEPGGAEMPPAQGLPALAADKPDATVSPSLATQPKGELHGNE